MSLIAKYAYLIIANRNKDQLQKLITMLDDSRNDIYLLVDKKSSLTDVKFSVNYSDINYLKPIDIYWGSYSIINAELELFKSSVEEHYDYYHLMSGQGMPLVNQDIIHKFFDSYPNHEFIQYQTESIDSINDKLNPHLFITHYDDGIHSEHSDKNYLLKLMCSIYRNIETIFNKHKMERCIPINKVSTASQWVSINDLLAQKIVRSSKWIYDHFYRSKVADELFIPTLINYYPKILKRVFDSTKYPYTPNNPYSNLRYIRKTSKAPHPKTWTISDYNELVNARNKGYLFSRKFDETVDNKIINRIFDDVMDVSQND